MSTISTHAYTTRLFLAESLPLMEASFPHPIPPMTHRLSRGWDQPDRDSFVIDDDSAELTQETLDALREYSLSIPTGAYEGKVWKRNEAARVMGHDKWFLCWYGPCDTPDHVQVNERPITIVAN